MPEWIEIDDAEGCPEEYKPPRYSKRGWIEFELLHVNQNPRYGYRYDIEIIDADLDSSVFWIQEGIGFDYFIDSYIDLQLPGKYRIEGIYGEYYRGDWGYDDDDEDWFFRKVVRME